MARINAYISFDRDGAGALLMRCRCGAALGSASGNYKEQSLEARYPVRRAGPYANPYGLGGNRFELREYYCPSCLVLYETEVALVGDPVLADVALELEQS